MTFGSHAGYAPDQAISHYLNQWWPSSLTYRARWVNSLWSSDDIWYYRYVFFCLWFRYFLVALLSKSHFMNLCWYINYHHLSPWVCSQIKLNELKTSFAGKPDGRICLKITGITSWSQSLSECLSHLTLLWLETAGDTNIIWSALWLLMPSCDHGATS